MSTARSGVLAAIAAFTLWGILPIFWKLLGFLPPATIVAQRTVWSLLLLLIVLRFRGETSGLFRALKRPATVGWHLLSGILLSLNWTIYVWATLHGHIIESALGYYLNPFFNMLAGALWFGEKHNRVQLAAIALALAGVAIQLPAAGKIPWIALILAGTFATYGVVRKKAPLEALSGLTAETLLLAPIGIGWIFLHSPGTSFGQTGLQMGLVVCSGLVTAVPLLCFGFATRKISLTTLGILQFIAPTLQFLVGWLVYHETLTSTRLYSFTLIWLAVGVYAWDAMRKASSSST